MSFNFGKLVIVIFCCITVLPMVMLLVFSAAYIAEGEPFSETTLGNLLKFDE